MLAAKLFITQRRMLALTTIARADHVAWPSSTDTGFLCNAIAGLNIFATSAFTREAIGK